MPYHSNSQNEIQNAGFIAVRNFKHAIKAEMRSAFIAKVVKYDEKHHLADLQPLANDSDGGQSAMFLDVPVAYNCYIIDEIIKRQKENLKKLDHNSHNGTDIVDKLPKHKFMRPGIPVVAVILDRDNDNWEGGRKVNLYTPNSSRLHNANDAIVVGVLGSDAIYG